MAWYTNGYIKHKVSQSNKPLVEELNTLIKTQLRNVLIFLLTKDIILSLLLDRYFQ